MLRLLGGFLDVENGAAFVGAALGAGVVGKLLLVTVGALGDAAGGQKIVRPAIGGTARRVAPFRIRHGAIPFVFAPRQDRTGSGLPCGVGGTPRHLF